MNRHVHIVCSSCPYPADHGRSIDIFEKIVALYNEDIKIHLHYFGCTEDKNVQELNHYCDTIGIYRTQKENENLARCMCKDNFPLLVEGLHSTEILNWVDPDKRKVLVLLYNDASAGNSKPGFFQKIFLWNENKRKKHQPGLRKDCLYVCLSQKDAEILREKYQVSNVTSLPAFVPWYEVKCQEGMGHFCLYHGNLSVPTNEKAAIWLLEKVFSELRYPFVIAGKDPSRRINKLAQLYSHTCVVANPSEKQINELVQKAHINIIPSLQSVCGRYKLLHSLFEGRHCITNDTMIENTDLEKACHIANDSGSKIMTIKNLMNQPFTAGEIELRKNLLLPRYDNSKNICSLLDWLY